MSEPYRYRCPECGSPVLRRCTGTHTDHDYSCRACYAKFEAPVDTKERPDRPDIEGSDWGLSDAELIGIVRSRSD